MSDLELTKEEDSSKKVKDSITYLINLVSDCVVRGGYSIDDVVKIKNSIENFTTGTSSEESQKDSVIFLINYIHIAQSKGKLTLEEAYHAYKNIDVFRT